MKKSVLFLLAVVVFANCKKELEEKPPLTVRQKNENLVKGKWRFVSFTDSSRTVTNMDPCWADNTLELKENKTAVISQGACIDTPLKPKDVEFKWVFVGDDVVDMGTDSVKLIVYNDTALQFQRINKSFLEYKWKR